MGLEHTALSSDERAGRTQWHGGARGSTAARRAMVVPGWHGGRASAGKGGAGCAGAVALARCGGARHGCSGELAVAQARARAS